MRSRSLRRELTGGVSAPGADAAGFVDDAHGAFAALRAAAGRCGEETIGGELTSRPKALIHVTCAHSTAPRAADGRRGGCSSDDAYSCLLPMSVALRALAGLVGCWACPPR
jgi:hypothetical protein